MHAAIPNRGTGEQPIKAAIPVGEHRRAPALAALRTAPRVTRVSQPEWATTSTDSAAKAKGVRYEKRVAEWLQDVCTQQGWTLWDHQWFCYKFGDKTAYFQPDFIIERPQGNILAEVKLTYVDTTAQLKRYVDWLRIFGLICYPITIVRNLTPDTGNIITELENATSHSVLHLWI